MSLTDNITGPLVTSLPSSLLGGDESGPSISAPSSVIVGVNDNPVTITVNGVEAGKAYTITVSSSGGGTNQVDTGTTAGSQIVYNSNWTALNPGTITITLDYDGETGVATRTSLLTTFVAVSTFDETGTTFDDTSNTWDQT